MQGGARFQEWARVKQAVSVFRGRAPRRLGHVPRVIIKFMDFELDSVIATTARNGCVRDAGSSHVTGYLN